MKKLFSLFAALLLLASGTAFAGVVDVRFANSSYEGDSYCVTVQVKAQDISFEIGSATVFFDYNTEALRNPSASPITFSESNDCAFGGTAAVYKNSFNSLETGTKGEGNYAILLEVPDQGCPTVSNTEWIDVAQFCFEVVDASVSADLEINAQYTAFNTVANNGEQHTLGELGAVFQAVDVRDVVENNTEITIYPNLTNGNVTVEYSLKTASEVQINIFDILGRNVYNNTQEAAAGMHTINADLSQLGSTYYLVEISNGVETVSEKVVLIK